MWGLQSRTWIAIVLACYDTTTHICVCQDENAHPCEMEARGRHRQALRHRDAGHAVCRSSQGCCRSLFCCSICGAIATGKRSCLVLLVEGCTRAALHHFGAGGRDRLLLRQVEQLVARQYCAAVAAAPAGVLPRHSFLHSCRVAPAQRTGVSHTDRQTPASSMSASITKHYLAL